MSDFLTYYQCPSCKYWVSGAHQCPLPAFSWTWAVGPTREEFDALVRRVEALEKEAPRAGASEPSGLGLNAAEVAAKALEKERKP